MGPKKEVWIVPASKKDEDSEVNVLLNQEQNPDDQEDRGLEIEESETESIVNMMAGQWLKVPEFISEKKNFKTWEADIRMWGALTPLRDEQKAQFVALNLEGHSSGIKEKILASISEEIRQAGGMEALIAFVKGIYDVEEMKEVFDDYEEFEDIKRKEGESVKEFLPRWDMATAKCNKHEIKLPDVVRAFKLLKSINIPKEDLRIVMTGIDYEAGKREKDLEKQAKAALKKYVDQDVIKKAVPEKEKQTFVTKEEVMTLLARSGNQSTSNQNNKRKADQNEVDTVEKKSVKGGYQGKKNKLGTDGTPMKCFNCKCDCQKNCNCPCRYHFRPDCPKNEVATNCMWIRFQENNLINEGMVIDEKGVVSDSNVVPVEYDIGNIYITEEEKEESQALIDCACPRTVTGKEWLKEFLGNESWENIKKSIEPSERVYKFGGGERRKSQGVISLPCRVVGKDIEIQTEIVEENLPLLVGNNFLEQGKVALDFKTKKIRFMGTEEKMPKTESGHWGLKIGKPKEKTEYSKKVGIDFMLWMKEESCESLSKEKKAMLKEEMCLLIQEKEPKPLSVKNINHLHQYFGHCDIRKIEALIKKAGRLNKETKENLQKVRLKCDSCNIFRNRTPKPAVVLPKLKKHNQLVTLDLKDWDAEDGARRYIAYAIDGFSKFTVGEFIADKTAERIGEFILRKWICTFGRPEVIHSDRGGEFVNEELTKIAERMDVRLTSTAAYSPNMNGINERNHATVDRMIQKMLFAQPDMQPEVALAWALNAKNTLENYQGYSPHFLVFGESPKLPAAYSSGPAAWEEVEFSDAVRQNFVALHQAREAFIEVENDQAIKTALKKKVYSDPHSIKNGDWIYFKNDKKKWEGPVKVNMKNGKLLHLVRKGQLLTINTDHAHVVKSGRIIMRELAKQGRQSEVETVRKEKNESDSKNDGELLGMEVNQNPGQHRVADPEVQIEHEQEEEQVPQIDAVQEEDEVPQPQKQNRPSGKGRTKMNPKCPSKFGRSEAQKQMWCKPCKGKQRCIGTKEVGESPVLQNVEEQNNGAEHDVVQEEDRAQEEITLAVRIEREKKISFEENGKTVQARVISRARKSSGKFNNWWNVRVIGSTHVQVKNLAEVGELQVVEETSAVAEVEKEDMEEEETFVVVIPRYLHAEQRCKDAKEVELGKYDVYDVYEEVKDEGQKKVGTNWVLTEKIKEGNNIVKARLTIRGDQEETGDIRKDSPTVRAGNVKMLLMVAAMKRWQIKTSDVESAFLQSLPLQREVFVMPPKERRVPGVLWKLKRPCYGLVDASRGFHLSFAQKLEEYRCKRSHLDPALFMYFREGNEEENS